MRTISLFLLMSFLSIFSVSAAVEDTSIVDELEQNTVEELKVDFQLKKFESCENLETVMEDYVKAYWNKNKQNLYPMPYYKGGGINLGVEVMEDSVAGSVDQDASVVGIGGEGSDDFSETNTQVKGVDESDIIKTDGEYIYYYNETDKYVYIVKAYPSTKAEIVKKIKIPQNFNAPVLYIGKNRLVIVASGYQNTDYSKRGYWINRNQKTYTIVFDTSDITNPKLTKLYASDGYLTKTRKIGDLLYVLSSNSFNIPYYNFKTEDDIQVDVSKMIPKGIELTKTSVKEKQNLTLKGKDLPYNFKAGNVSGCNSIEYLLPDEDTLEQYDFSPEYNIISVINIANIEESVKTKVIAGSNAEVFMSQENLYITSNMYTSNNFRCPADAMCIMPWFPRGNNTLIHKLNIDGNTLKYQDSNIIPGQPLTQYSMDEYKGDFRIITKNRDEVETSLYILDEDLQMKGSLTGLGETEEFKSSRFMGDTLFLVTFKRVDPFFAIDISDSTKPKILGELKIPGYSTYLHPYDDKHIIGLGYDTKENQWGGTVNNGIKIDLYEVNYNKKCGDLNLSLDEINGCKNGDYKGIIVKQKFTKTLGENRSYSEALDNPRMFMWNSEENTLLLPVSLYINDNIDIYKSVDFFNGLVSLNIDKNTGIKENYKISHMDTSGIKEERIKDCSKYTIRPEQLECKKLLDGSEYCPTNTNSYVPPYCYADSQIGEFLASRSWNYSNQFVKRVLWIGGNVYSVSDTKVMISNLKTGKEETSLEMMK